jgi:multicomponent Na+:H+ antiporter subunit C
MSAADIWLLTGGALVAIGLAAMLLAPALMRKLLAFNVMGSGVFVLLLALRPRAADGVADPVAQVLILTGIVIAIAATALGLTLARRYHRATGSAELPVDDEAGTDD